MGKPRGPGQGKPPGLPDKQRILDFIRESPGRVGRREIARAFSIKGAERIQLKSLLKELKEEGLIEAGRRYGGGARKAKAGALPAVAVLEVLGPDPDGELQARPMQWHGDGPPPRVYIAPERGHPAFARGDRVLARLTKIDEGYEARVIRHIAAAASGAPGQAARRVVGVFRRSPRPGEGGRIHHTDRRAKSDYHVEARDTEGAATGELVLAELLPPRRAGPPAARVIERIGGMDNPRAFSLIAIHTHDIPVAFPAEALDEADGAGAVELGRRTDLRAIPLVTIDGADARDFDDAVWAEPDPDPGNQGGWHAVVAIADVAWYVRPARALDRAARRRGNSVYFPDRVVPMLPEKLSNDLCSLRPAEDRAVMAVHLWFDGEGNKRGHRFVRGLMRSAARHTYEQVQAAQDGRPDETTEIGRAHV